MPFAGSSQEGGVGGLWALVLQMGIPRSPLPVSPSISPPRLRPVLPQFLWQQLPGRGWPRVPALTPGHPSNSAPEPPTAAVPGTGTRVRALPAPMASCQPPRTHWDFHAGTPPPPSPGSSVLRSARLDVTADAGLGTPDATPSVLLRVTTGMGPSRGAVWKLPLPL